MLTRIAVFVSGGGTNLQALIDAEGQGKIQCGSLELVISSNPDAFALVRAERAGIPTEVISKKDLGSQESFETELKKVLDKYEIDLIVLAGFMTILSENFTKDYPKRIINVHPALIPSFCGKGLYGLKVHQAALDYGVKVTGATVHYVNEVPDGGEIIFQRAVYIEDDDTPEKLQRRVMEQAEWIILPRAVEQVSREILINKRNADK